MIKTILVPATGEESDVSTFRAALEIARQFSAHMDVLHVRLDPVETAVSMTSDPSGGMLIGGVIEQLERDALEREAKAKHLFDGFCASEHLAVLDAPADLPCAKPTVQWHVETGDEARRMAAYG